MPKPLLQYRVFIGSPGGLDEERERFHRKLERFTAVHTEPRGIIFHPVRWESTVGGVGRPQELINEDLKQCDYAVFVLHDRWGSPTGGIYASGVEEEWALAEQLYKANKIRNIALFFKSIPPNQLRDPGKQLEAVLTFRSQIEQEKRYLFKSYNTLDDFADILEEYLAKWLRDHEAMASALSAEGLIAGGANIMAASDVPVALPPSPAFWVREGLRLLESEVPDYHGALFCAVKATDGARSDVEWAQAANIGGVAQFHLGKLADAIISFTSIAQRFSTSIDPERRYWLARALFDNGVALGALGRSEEEITVYDDLLARFGAATELPLRGDVARALFNKVERLHTLGRTDEAADVYHDFLARFGEAMELPLREQVGKAIFNEGGRLSRLGRTHEAIAAYDDLLARFSGAQELPLREQVARTLVNKGRSLGALGYGEEEIVVYDDLLARFSTATELPLREAVAQALFNKGDRLHIFGRSEEELAVYDDLLARCGAATELPLREQVAKGLFNKGVALGSLRRNEQEIAVYDDLLARFDTAAELVDII